MIKSNGNYLAVRVPEGAYGPFKWTKNDTIEFGLNTWPERIDPKCQGIIMGLLCDLAIVTRKLGDLSRSIPDEEWNQWLIIKKG